MYDTGTPRGRVLCLVNHVYLIIGILGENITLHARWLGGSEGEEAGPYGVNELNITDRRGRSGVVGAHPPNGLGPTR